MSKAKIRAQIAKKKNFTAYEEAKKYFEARGKIERYSHDQAKAWFAKKGFGDEFITYDESKNFFEKKGILKKEIGEPDGSGPGQFAFFSRDGEDVDKNAFHDVIVGLFLSDFVYSIGSLRNRTKHLGFTNEEEQLREEVIVGDSFNEDLFSDEKKAVIEKYENIKKKEWDTKIPLVHLLQGNLCVSKEVDVVAPYVNMEKIEDVIRYPGYKQECKYLATELAVTAMQSMKANKVHLHKFDAYYYKKNLVYAIFGRERVLGDDVEENDLFLTFRGTDNSRDMYQNFQAPLVELLLREDNSSGKCYIVEQITYQKIEVEPDLFHKLQHDVVEVCGTPILIHQGFLSYLFADRGLDDLKDDDKEDDSMYTNIKLNVRRLIDNKSAYTKALYATGHSLGGALAMLTSFFLACDKDINSKALNGDDWEGVKSISFAAPLIGNVGLMRAFEVVLDHNPYEKSEENSFFTNIRVANNRDLIPMMPPLMSYRDMAGIHIYLNRPSILTLWQNRRPDIYVIKAHWGSTFDLRRPWRIFHPTSFIAGFMETSIRWIGSILTTAPIILLVLYMMVRPLAFMIPPISSFKTFGREVGEWQIVQETFFGEILDLVNHDYARVGAFVIMLLLMLALGARKDAFVAERIGIIIILYIILGQILYYVLDSDLAIHVEKHSEVYFVIGIIVAQVAAFIIRNPLQVMGTVTHSMDNYYANLRPHHREVSASSVIVKNADWKNQ
jgi:hypothetical protein